MENRRTFLQWLSRTPLLGCFVAPVIPVEAEAVSDEVVRLLDLQARLQAANLDVDLAYRHYDECRRRAAKLRGQCPVRMHIRSARDEWYWRHSFERYQRRRANADEIAGVAASNQRIEELRYLRDDVALEVWNIKATTMEGFKIKARLSKLTPYAATSLAADINALSGEKHV